MLKEAGLEPGQVDAGKISFVLAPRLNAAGRLDDAVASYNLLTTASVEQATALARGLLYHEVRIQRERLGACQQTVVSIEMRPASLYQPHKRVGKVGHHTPQEIRSRHEIGIKDSY